MSYDPRELDEMAARMAPPEAYEDDPDVLPPPSARIIALNRAAPPAPLTEADKAALPDLDFAFWQEIDFAAIPRLDFVYSDFYARGYTSVSLAAPKVGKSMLALAEAIDMVTGRGILTGRPREPQRVLYYNAEDDKHTLDARVAALCTFYRIPQSELAGRLIVVSGVGRSDFVMVAGQDPVINEPLFVRLERFCLAHSLDAAVFDPLQDLSHSPETNEVFRRLGQRLRAFASACGIALGLVHHTRKVAPGMTPSIDDMRGGSALRGTARFNRILVAMTEDEAIKGGIENHRHYFRLGDIESNLAPPSSEVNRWFEKVSVPIANGEHIGAVRRWDYPDAMDGLTPDDARRVQMAVGALHRDPPRENPQSKSWVGHLIVETLSLDLDMADKNHRARVQTMIRAWVKSDVLRVDEVHDGRTGRDVKVLLAGENNPCTREDYR